LRALRRRAGRTQEDLAQALGVSDSTWSRFEQGTLPVPPEALTFVEDLLGAPHGSLRARADLLSEHYRGATGTSAWRHRVVEHLR